MEGTNSSSESTSLRERKKAKTRQSLIDESQRLFSHKGHAHTTLEEICEQVEIRPQTLLRYFESKAHLALAPMSDIVEDLRRKIADPGRTATTIDLWREHVEARAVFHKMSDAAGIRRYFKWTARDAVLVAMTAALDHQTLEYLAQDIAEDHGVGADDLHSTQLAGMLVAGWNSVFIRWLGTGDDPTELGRQQHSVIDFAVQNMAGTSVQQLREVAGS